MVRNTLTLVVVFILSLFLGACGKQEEAAVEVEEARLAVESVRPEEASHGDEAAHFASKSDMDPANAQAVSADGEVSFEEVGDDGEEVDGENAAATEENVSDSEAPGVNEMERDGEPT